LNVDAKCQLLTHLNAKIGLNMQDNNEHGKACPVCGR